MDRLKFIHDKILLVEAAKRMIEGWRLKGDSIVFTNGCFDILHQGHVTYLAQAASEGNRLVVGLNTDRSVKALEKGDDRPINTELSRAFVLAGLGCVDMVVLFDEDTPLDLISALQPDVLAKGADYSPDEKNPDSPKYIVGTNIVKAKGGKVVAIPFVEGFSTTSIINKAKG